MNGERPSDDLVAEYHAGALDDAEARRVHALIEVDPDAQRTLAGLDALTLDLHGLRDADATMPAEVAARIHEALAAAPPLDGPVAAPALDAPEPGRTAVPSLDAARRRRRVAWASGGVAAAAAVAAAVFLPTLGGPGPGPTTPPVAAPPSPALDLGADAQPGRIMSLLGSDDPGVLADAERLAGCLSANGIDPDATLLGSRQVTIDGVPATLLLLPGSEPPAITALAVGESCAAGEPDLVARREIG
ncbi:hypothetical protein [Rhodococcus sp. HNM0569]|uniref:anti-sigma factor family protein n=1 Tax=Rhodococcus sp. HNM0569 TaxID=2716340 RepID=UPI00146D3A3F|nr:hypothetical protein [Rhodococcus sp. HNM0569]NLU84494.1 hypothetical protein [Rhodococcus sp. HNM0569]